MNETLSEQQISDLRRAFSSVDTNNDGIVRTKDVSTIIRNLGENYQAFIIEEEELKHLIEQIDLDGSGQLTFAQFLTIIAYKLNVNDTVEELQEAFLMFDRNNSGFINFDDLWRVMQNLGENITKNEVEHMMREADRDLDGKISFAEFIEMVRHA